MKLSRIAALVLATGVSSQALALELGELKVSSAINQPFAAKLELVGPDALDPTKIRIDLSARQAFEPLGQKVQVKVDDIVTEKGRRYLVLSSADNVSAPFVSLQVDIAGLPSGRVTNDYDLLLDDKPSSDLSALPQENRSAAPAAAAKPKVTVNSPAKTTATDLASGHTGKSDFYGPISPSDTLWSLANGLRPDRSVSVYQTMIAIQRKNPEAFLDGDINRMVKGSILRVPTLAEVQAVDPDEARRRFVSGTTVTASRLTQNDSPQVSRSVAQPKVAEKPKTSTSTPAVVKASSNGPKVDESLLQQKLNEQAQRHAEEMAQLRKELSSSTDNLEEVLAENQRLKSRINQVMEELASLQQQLADEVKLQEELRQVIASQNAKLNQPQANKEEGDFFGQLLNTTWGLALLGAIPGLLLLLLGLRWWRGRNKDEVSEERSFASRIVNKDESADDGMDNLDGAAAAALAAGAAGAALADEDDIQDDPLADASLDDMLASLPDEEEELPAAEAPPTAEQEEFFEEDDFAIRLDEESDLDDWVVLEEQTTQQRMSEAEEILEDQPEETPADDLDAALDASISEVEALLSEEDAAEPVAEPQAPLVAEADQAFDDESLQLPEQDDDVFLAAAVVQQAADDAKDDLQASTSAAVAEAVAEPVAEDLAFEETAEEPLLSELPDFEEEVPVAVEPTEATVPPLAEESAFAEEEAPAEAEPQLADLPQEDDLPAFDALDEQPAAMAPEDDNIPTFAATEPAGNDLEQAEDDELAFEESELADFNDFNVAAADALLAGMSKEDGQALADDTAEEDEDLLSLPELDEDFNFDDLDKAPQEVNASVNETELDLDDDILELDEDAELANDDLLAEIAGYEDQNELSLDNLDEDSLLEQEEGQIPGQKWDAENTLNWEAPKVDSIAFDNNPVALEGEGLDWQAPKAGKEDFIDIDELMKDADSDLSEEDPYGEWSLALDMKGYEDLVGKGDEEDDSQMGSKLDLARAYMEIDDLDSARELLDEVQAKGSADEKAEAIKLLGRLG